MRGTAGELPKESLTIPSIVRQAQYENLGALVERIKNDEGFINGWFDVEKKNLAKKRRKRKDLTVINEPSEEQLRPAA